MKQIRIGTLVGGGDAVRVLPQILPHGFESFSLTFWQSTNGLDLSETAKRVKEILAEKGVPISSLGIFGNPLTGEGDNADTLASWERLIDHAHEFGTDLVAG
ncbi:TIM barrel protein, partial [Paenibacillus sepulcri]|nr:TIM barrel protein [Paenibacillus sepulcri]